MYDFSWLRMISCKCDIVCNKRVNKVPHPNASQRKETIKLLNMISSTPIVPNLGASMSQVITTGAYSIESLLE
jgi:hypothetical protein